MIDFHIEIHEQMPPSSAMVYAKSMGLRAFALILPVSAAVSDPCDTYSAFNSQILAVQKHIHELAVYYDVQAFFGIKLIHIPPCLLEKTIESYRTLDIDLIGVHGESITDIVPQGTNFSAITAKADLLFNPGNIDEKCAELAKKNNVFLEISTHTKHAYSNAHIAKMAAKYGAGLALGSCARRLEEIHQPEMQRTILKACCVEKEHSYELLQKIQKNCNQRTI